MTATREHSLLREREQELKEAAAWSSLIYGVYSLRQVLPAVRDERWQRLRVSLLGTSLQYKYDVLKAYMDAAPQDEQRRIRVTNYVYALKRGGIIR